MSQEMPVLQEDREDESLSSPSHASDCPGSPEETKTLDPAPEEKVYSVNCPENRASVVLTSRNLWRMFDAIGTEMIVTRRGRRMFPAIKVEVYDLKPDVSYVLLMDMAPVDKYRYKYNAGWVRCFEEECAPTRLYIHPDSPALGSHWTSVVINFYKLKLTNNQLDKQGHVIVNSMHRYQPRLHIVESDDVNKLNWETRKTFIFPGTQFTTVTAYQNDKITQLKIQNNPFAKGFRSPFSRCRSRNPPGPRFTIRSGSCSDSGIEEQQSVPTLISPQLILPGGQDIQRIAGFKRKSDVHTYDQHQSIKRQMCVLAQDPASFQAHKPFYQLASSSDSPVVLIYRPVVASSQPEVAPVGTYLKPTVLQSKDPHMLPNTMYTIVSSPAEHHMDGHRVLATSMPLQSHSSLSSYHPATSLSLPLSLPATSLPGTSDSKPMHVIVSSVDGGKKPPMDISCLTKEGVAAARSVPPLLQVLPQPQDKLCSSLPEAVREPMAMRPTGQEVLLVQAPPSNGLQRLVIVGEKMEGAAQVRLSSPQQPQMVIPVAYDQQVVSMPIYRLGSQSLQPVQILAPLPPQGASSIKTT